MVIVACSKAGLITGVQPQVNLIIVGLNDEKRVVYLTHLGHKEAGMHSLTHSSMTELMVLIGGTTTQQNKSSSLSNIKARVF